MPSRRAASAVRGYGTRSCRAVRPGIRLRAGNPRARSPSNASPKRARGTRSSTTTRGTRPLPRASLVQPRSPAAARPEPRRLRHGNRSGARARRPTAAFALSAGTRVVASTTSSGPSAHRRPERASDARRPAGERRAAEQREMNAEAMRRGRDRARRSVDARALRSSAAVTVDPTRRGTLRYGGRRGARAPRGHAIVSRKRERRADSPAAPSSMLRPSRAVCDAATPRSLPAEQAEPEPVVAHECSAARD